jgi:hypothetical protein
MYKLFEDRKPNECPFCKREIDLLFWNSERTEWINENRSKYYTFPHPKNNMIKERRHTYPYPHPQCECKNQIQLAYFNTNDSDGNYLCVMPRREQNQ